MGLWVGVGDGSVKVCCIGGLGVYMVLCKSCVRVGDYGDVKMCG